MKMCKSALGIAAAAYAVFLLVGMGMLSQADATSDVVFVEEGVLYHAPKNRPDKKTSAASGVARIMDHKHEAKKLIYVAAPSSPGSHEHEENDLQSVASKT